MKAKRKPYRAILAASNARGIIDSETAEEDIKRLRRKVRIDSPVIYRTRAGSMIRASLATIIFHLTRTR